jgi:hypothetical protein
MNVKTRIVLTVLLLFLFTGTAQAGLVRFYSKGMSQTLRTHRNKINLAHVTYVCEHGWGKVKKEHCQAEKWLKRLLAPPPVVWAAGNNSKLYRIAVCESGSDPPDWHINTGNGFFGGLQFDLQTWASVGGSGLPSDASAGEQEYRATLLIRDRGYSPWPVCGSR